MSSSSIAARPLADGLSGQASPQAAVRDLPWSGPRVSAVCDGYIDLPVEVFEGAAPERIAALLEQAGLPAQGPIRTAVSTFLIEDDGRVLLVDTGMGHIAGPSMGHLLASLALAGFAPEDVTDIVLTHLHRDHCGGLLTADGQAAFPKATVHVSRIEYEYWTDSVRAAQAPEGARRFFDVAMRAMAVCAGRIRLLESDARITPRVRVAAIPGHTVGHSAIWVDAQEQPSALCIWGDIVHCAPLQIPAPEIAVRFDTDADAARDTRRALLRQLADRKTLVAGAHVPFPGFGHIVTGSDGGFRLAPLN